MPYRMNIPSGKLARVSPRASAPHPESLLTRGAASYSVRMAASVIPWRADHSAPLPVIPEARLVRPDPADIAAGELLAREAAARDLAMLARLASAIAPEARKMRRAMVLPRAAGAFDPPKPVAMPPAPPRTALVAPHVPDSLAGFAQAARDRAARRAARETPSVQTFRAPLALPPVEAAPIRPISGAARRGAIWAAWERENAQDAARIHDDCEAARMLAHNDAKERARLRAWLEARAPFNRTR